MLSRLVITFLPRSKSLLISWLKSSPAVILEPKKIKSVTVSIVSPYICHEVLGLEGALEEQGFHSAATRLEALPVIKAMVFPVVMYGWRGWTTKKTAPKN